MFQEITIRNFRTHRDTTVTLGPITLIIGNNNSGKTNLLTALQHFSRLIARGRPDNVHLRHRPTVRRRGRRGPRPIWENDFFLHRHRLADREEPMIFKCKWHSPSLGQVNYTMELYSIDAHQSQVGCRERIRLSATDSKEKEFSFGFDHPTNIPGLRTLLTESSGLAPSEMILSNRFFRDAASFFTYNFQPSYLKSRIAVDSLPPDDMAEEESLSQNGALEASTSRERPGIDRLVIASQIGYEGGRLQDILAVLEDKDRQTYDRFILQLRRFESTFHGILVDRQQEDRTRVRWQFDLQRRGAPRVDAFPIEIVSDGLLRATAISLLASMRNPPALLMLEEIENGLNPGNIGALMSLLWESLGTPDSAHRGYRTQVILTSHSPSVLREFADHLNYVYHVRLDKHGYVSDVRNLGETLEVLHGLGTIDGEPINVDGKPSVRLSPYQLTELWYSGTFG